MWKYLAEHPEIEFKCHLPNELWQIIFNYVNNCPLCECFEFDPCDLCPLNNCSDTNALYTKWYRGNQIERKQAAEEIVRRIEEWEV